MQNHTTRGTAVVVGATGIIGRAITAKLAELGGWRVLGVTRSGGTVPGVDQVIAVDLRDPEEARRRLAPAAGATHLFFAAYLPQASWAAEVGPNVALLVNAVEGLEAVGAPLRHVTLITGAKYYGVHVGPSGWRARTPGVWSPKRRWSSRRGYPLSARGGPPIRRAEATTGFPRAPLQLPTRAGCTIVFLVPEKKR